MSVHEGEAVKKGKVIVHLKSTPRYNQKSLCIELGHAVDIAFYCVS